MSKSVAAWSGGRPGPGFAASADACMTRLLIQSGASRLRTAQQSLHRVAPEIEDAIESTTDEEDMRERAEGAQWLGVVDDIAHQRRSAERLELVGVAPKGVGARLLL